MFMKKRTNKNVKSNWEHVINRVVVMFLQLNSFDELRLPQRCFVNSNVFK